MAGQKDRSAAPEVMPAAEIRRMMHEHEQAKLAEAARKQREEDEKKKAMMDIFHQPLTAPPQDLIARAAPLVRAAAERGATEVLIYRFPNELCTDNGRAINNGEAGWEETLTGRPRSVFEFWRDHLRDKGYKLQAEIVEFPGGMPGDVGFILSWK